MQQLKELMSRDVKVISPDMTIGEAAKTMRDGDFGMMPVGENDRMIGTISGTSVGSPPEMQRCFGFTRASSASAFS